MNFIVILAAMAAFWHESGAQEQPVRRGKFLGFSSDDVWSDIFDDLSDPLAMPHNTLSVRDQVLHKIQKEKPKPSPEAIPPLPISQSLVHTLATTTNNSYVKPISYQSSPRPILQDPQPVIVYDTSTNKLEVTPPGFASRPPPITEGMFLIGGQFGDTERPVNISAGEAVGQLKLFWSSVGDIIENTPFFPIQVNVPDMIAAMTSFFAQRIPLVNRLTNPNEPRPIAKLPNVQQTAEFQYPEFPQEASILEYRQMAPPARKSKPKKNKKKQKKNRRRSTTESIPLYSQDPSLTPRSQVTRRAWFSKTTESPTPRTTTQETFKLFNHNNNPGSEAIKYKSTSFTRKNNRWADRELFNFKHSDISNSPIMILNMPSRPVYLYGFKHEQKTEFPVKGTDSGVYNRWRT